MNIQIFLNRISTNIGANQLYPFSFNSYLDEDTTSLRVKSIAEVAANDLIVGFHLQAELYNNYAFSQECPCLIELNQFLKAPVIGDDLDKTAHDFAIEYQYSLIKQMIKSNSTDELTDEEIIAYENWDRSDFLMPIKPNTEIVSYLGLSEWAAKNIEIDVKSWLNSYKK